MSHAAERHIKPEYIRRDSHPWARIFIQVICGSARGKPPHSKVAPLHGLSDLSFPTCSPHHKRGQEVAADSELSHCPHGTLGDVSVRPITDTGQLLSKRAPTRLQLPSSTCLVMGFTTQHHATTRPSKDPMRPPRAPCFPRPGSGKSREVMLPNGKHASSGVGRVQRKVGQRARGKVVWSPAAVTSQRPCKGVTCLPTITRR